MCAPDKYYLLHGIVDGSRGGWIFMMNESDWFHVSAREFDKFISAKNLKPRFKWSCLVLTKTESRYCWSEVLGVFLPFLINFWFAVPIVLNKFRPSFLTHAHHFTSVLLVVFHLPALRCFSTSVV